MVLEDPLHGDGQEVPQVKPPLIGIDLTLGDFLSHHLILDHQVDQCFLSVGEVGAEIAVDQETTLEVREHIAQAPVVINHEMSF